MIEKTASPSLSGRSVKWAAVFCYAALIFYLSSLSVAPDTFPPFFMFDKILHFTEYGIFGALLCFAFKEENRAPRPVLLAFIAGTLYGLSDEFHQYFVPTRESDVLDLLADAAGSGAGAFFASLMNRGGRLD